MSIGKNSGARIDRATYFERLLTRFSTPEEIFGPLSLSALEQDRYQRVTADTLVEAHIAFLDEIFKSNSALLNSLLAIINERVFHEPGQALPVPLLSLFGASNETPEDNGLVALYDRFLLRVVVPPLAGDQSLRALFNLQPGQPTATIMLKVANPLNLEAVELEDAARDLYDQRPQPDQPDLTSSPRTTAPSAQRHPHPP